MSRRIYAGSTITLQTIVTVGGTPTDASTITFKWKEGGARGAEQSATPTRTGTGTYTVTITPTKPGHLYYRWDTEGALDYAEEGALSIADSQFKITA